MSNLKRYLCQLGKILAGLSVVVVAVPITLGSLMLIGELFTHLLENYQIVMAACALVASYVILSAALLIGDVIFEKYNICQRFK